MPATNGQCWKQVDLPSGKKRKSETATSLSAVKYRSTLMRDKEGRAFSPVIQIGRPHSQPAGHETSKTRCPAGLQSTLTA